ncbi:MAG: FecR domain-containing protein [Candidatus Omnitrophica bacterium]|nr:FecR domain-containing protein [Candidatus Omnitrophota bacterium]
MKKSFLVLLMVLFIGLFFIATLKAAEIVYTKGNVELQYSKEGVWKRAKTGMPLDIGDSVRTARNSKADIAVDDGKRNLIRLEEKTLLLLDSTSPGQINRLDLSHGKIYADIATVQSGLTFEVSTPSAVAGVRGTGWSVDSQENQDEVACYEDSVFVKAFDEAKNLITEIILNEGFKTMIERFKRPSELMGLTDREMNRWNDVKEEVTERTKQKPRKDKKAGRSDKFKKANDVQEKIKDLDEIKDLTDELKQEESIGCTDSMP